MAGEGAFLRLSERTEVSENLFILRFEPDGPLPFERKDGRWAFAPGQFLTLGLQGPEKRLERAYSVASSPYDAHFEFFVEVVPGGKLSPLIKALAVGQTVSCRKPAGRFTLDPDAKSHVQVATVTGLAPFLSVLRTHRVDRAGGKAPADRRFLLIYGASHAQELAYSDVLRETAKEGFLAFVPTVSRPWESTEWEGEVGRCEEVLRKHLDASGFAPAETVAYLCGNPEMIRNAEGVLKRARFRPPQIRKEEYW